MNKMGVARWKQNDVACRQPFGRAVLVFENGMAGQQNVVRDFSHARDSLIDFPRRTEKTAQLQPPRDGYQ
jgi:hypothetical protein